MSDFNDFGFTAVDESEIDTPTDEIEEANARTDKLYNAIKPLLKNLKANPGKEYIHWPNRVDKVEEFEANLKKIYEGRS